MKKWLAVVGAVALACGGGDTDGSTPTADAGTGTDERGLWIDAEVGGLMLENDNKVSSSLVVMRGGSRVQTATLTANGKEITKEPTSDMYDWWLFGWDIGATPGSDIELVAKDGEETATLKLTCPTNVVLNPVAGPLTPGQTIEVSWNGSIGGYVNDWSRSVVGIYPCDSNGTHMHIPPPGGGNTMILNGDETRVELTVPDDHDQDAYKIRLFVLGNMVDNDQGIGYCQMVREQVVTGNAR